MTARAGRTVRTASSDELPGHPSRYHRSRSGRPWLQRTRDDLLGSAPGETRLRLHRQPVSDHRRGDLLDVVVVNKLGTVEQRERLRGLHQRQRSSRAGTHLHAVSPARSSNDVYDEALELLADHHL